MPSRRAVLLSSANGPSLDLNFLTGSLDSRVSFTRSSVASYFDATGTLQSAATNTPRFDYGASPGGVTNWVLNSTAFGAVSADNTELVTNGNFALNPLHASQNTIQNGWQWSSVGGTTTVTYGSGSVTITADGTNQGRIDTSITTVVGVTYTIQWDSNGAVGVAVGTGQGGSTIANITSGTTGTGVRAQFTATATTTWIRFYRTPAGVYVLDNISVVSAGKFPTGTTSTLTGTMREITVGTYQGMNGHFLRVFGTATTTGPQAYSHNTGLLYIIGEVWSHSAYIALTSGTFTNTSQITLRHYTEGGGISFTPTATLTRYTITRTATIAGFVQHQLRWNHTDTTTAVDFTLFIAAPQSEKGSVINAWVPTSTVAENVGATPLGLLIEEARTNQVRNNTAVGVVAGSSTEIITNGTFALDPVNASQSTIQNGWQWSRTGGSVIPVWNGSLITLAGDNTDSVRLDQSFTTVSGVTYTLTVTVGVGSGATSVLTQIGPTQGGSSLYNANVNVGAGNKIQFTASSATSWIRFSRLSTTSVTIDDVSVVSAGKGPTSTGVLFTSASGLIASVSGTGTENGITYVDIRITGTADGSAFRMSLDSSTSTIVGAVGDSWTNTVYCSLVGGSAAGLAPALEIREWASGVSNGLDNTAFTPATGPLNARRQTHRRAISVVGTTHVQPTIRFANTNGAVIDCTLRIGGGQFELGAFATSLISTSTVAVTRAVDTPIVLTAPWYNLSYGTVVAEYLVPIAAGSTSNQIIFQLDTTNGNERVVVYVSQGNTSTSHFFSDTIGSTGGSGVAVSTINAVNKVAMSFSRTATSLCLNGAVPVSSALTRAPLAFTHLRLGENTGPSSILGGYMLRLRYFPREFSEAELRNITR